MNWMHEPMLLACGAYIIGTATPGPSTLLIATNSMRFGRRIGLVTAYGASSGALGLGLIIACGIAMVFSAMASWAEPMRIAGGLYLFWLAAQSVRSAFSDLLDADNERIKTSQTFSQGLVISVFNPNAILSWIATVAIATSSTSASEKSAFIAVALCGVIGIIIYCGYAMLFAHQRTMHIYREYRRVVDMLVACAFGAVGLMMIV